MWSQEKAGPSGRINHQSIVYKNSLIVVGGFEEQYQGNYDDLLLFDYGKIKIWIFILIIEKNTWKRLLIKCTQKTSPISRFAHSSFLLDHCIYVFGGQSKSEGPLNDLCYIDLTS